MGLNHRLHIALPIIVFAVLLISCSPQSQRLRQDQIIDITWDSLQPITSSQDRENWQVQDAKRVYGRTVVDQFSGLVISNCPGPSMPENRAIRSGSEYWYIKVAPRNQTNEPTASPQPATVIAVTPEPLFHEAVFLIDPMSGEIVARKYTCR
jgi:hypothetical protein